jgi:preprotein translocase subunit YajC
MMKKIKGFIVRRKVLSLVIFLLIVGLVVFLIVRNDKKEETRYVLSEVSRGDIITTVTGTGQVESLNSLEIKPETSGKVNYVGVKEGQEVKQGTLIASIDCKDQKNSLESAKLSLEKLITADPLSVLKAENNLESLYNSSWNDLTSFMNEVNNIFTEMEDFYVSGGFLSYSNTSSLKSVGREKINSSLDLLEQAERKFDDLEEEYQNLSKLSDKQEILELMNKTLEVAKIISSSVKGTETATNYVIERKDETLTDSESSSARDSVSSWLNKINSHVNTLSLNINSVDESTKSLEETKAGGADELDIRSSELSVQNKLDAYNDCYQSSF